MSAEDAEEKGQPESIESPKRRFTKSFPQLRFGNFVIGEALTTTMPGLSRPSRLGKELLDAANNAGVDEDSKSSIDQKYSDLVVSAARRFYKGSGKLPENYTSISPLQDGGKSMEMLAKYLLTGSTSHIDSLDKCLAMIKMMKTYGLCEDVLCDRVLNILKEIVSVKDVLKVISIVGHKAKVEVWPSGVEGEGESEIQTVWKTGDQFFFDLATDKAAEVFADGATAMELVNEHPLIAGLFLCQTPLVYEAKLPKPPAEEDDEDE